MPSVEGAKKRSMRADRPPARVASLPDPGRWLLIPLVLIALIVFSPVFDAGFTDRDDMQTVARNPQMLGPWSQVGKFWTTVDQGNGNLYLPLTQTGWYLLARIARLNQPTPDGIWLSPVVFHLANVFLHTLGGCLVFLILRELVRNSWAAAAGALLFLIHPLQVEPVAWITGLRDVLSGVLCLLALYWFLRFVQSSSQPAGERQSSPWICYTLALLAFMLCILAKPSGVITPILAALLVIPLFYAHPQTEIEQQHLSFASVWRTALLPLIPWLILAVPIILIERHVQPATGIPGVSLWLRPAVAGDAIAFYLYKLLIPVSLGIDYARTSIAVAHSHFIYWTWIIPAVLLAIAIAIVRRRPLLSAGILLFVAGLLPVLGLIKFDFQVHSTVADRYVYISMLGVSLALASVLNRARRAALAWTGAALVLAALATLAIAQAGYWKSDFALFDHAADVNPRSVVAHVHLAKIALERREPDEAIQHYRVALATDPQDGGVHHNLANVLLAQGRLIEATKEYRLALPDQPRDAGLRNDLGIALAQSGQLSQARDAFEQAIALNPGDAQPEVNLANVLAQLGDPAGAANHYRRALTIDPNLQQAQQGLRRLAQQGLQPAAR